MPRSAEDTKNAIIKQYQHVIEGKRGGGTNLSQLGIKDIVANENIAKMKILKAEIIQDNYSLTKPQLKELTKKELEGFINKQPQWWSALFDIPG